MAENQEQTAVTQKETKVFIAIWPQEEIDFIGITRPEKNHPELEHHGVQCEVQNNVLNNDHFPTLSHSENSSVSFLLLIREHQMQVHLQTNQSQVKPVEVMTTWRRRLIQKSLVCWLGSVCCCVCFQSTFSLVICFGSVCFSHPCDYLMSSTCWPLYLNPAPALSFGHIVFTLTRTSWCLCAQTLLRLCLIAFYVWPLPCVLLPLPCLLCLLTVADFLIKEFGLLTWYRSQFLLLHLGLSVFRATP